MAMYTLLHLKWITHRTYCIAQGTLLIKLCGKLKGREFGEEWTCVYKSLCRSPEMIRTVVGYAPIQSIELFKK